MRSATSWSFHYEKLQRSRSYHRRVNFSPPPREARSIVRIRQVLLLSPDLDAIDAIRAPGRSIAGLGVGAPHLRRQHDVALTAQIDADIERDRRQRGMAQSQVLCNDGQMD